MVTKSVVLLLCQIFSLSFPDLPLLNNLALVFFGEYTVICWVTVSWLLSLLNKLGQKGPCCQWVYRLDDKVQEGLEWLAIDVLI